MLDGAMRYNVRSPASDRKVQRYWQRADKMSESGNTYRRRAGDWVDIISEPEKGARYSRLWRSEFAASAHEGGGAWRKQRSREQAY